MVFVDTVDLLNIKNIQYYFYFFLHNVDCVYVNKHVVYFIAFGF